MAFFENCKSINFNCRFLKSTGGVLYGAENQLEGPFNWRAECLHPHYNKLIYVYAHSQSKAHLKLFDKWCYLLNRGTAYPRRIRSKVCGDITVQKSEYNSNQWQAICKNPTDQSRNLSMYGCTIEKAVERLESTYKYIMRCTVEEEADSSQRWGADDEVYARLVKRGYSNAECNGEPGEGGDSLHKPYLTKAKLDEELDNIHYRMVCVRMSRSVHFVHYDIGCCDPDLQEEFWERLNRDELPLVIRDDDRPIDAPTFTAEELEEQRQNNWAALEEMLADPSVVVRDIPTEPEAYAKFMKEHSRKLESNTSYITTWVS